MQVEYRNVVGFTGYRVGTDGSVWSGRRGRGWRQLRTRCNPRTGYITIGLLDNGKLHTKNVHSLVLTAFVGPRPAGHESRHLNGNRLDASISNLCWGTKRENANDRVRHGTQRGGGRGETHASAKLTADDVRAIRRQFANGESGISLGKQYGVSKIAIYLLVHRKTWKSVA